MKQCSQELEKPYCKVFTVWDKEGHIDKNNKIVAGKSPNKRLGVALPPDGFKDDSVNGLSVKLDGDHVSGRVIQAFRKEEGAENPRHPAAWPLGEDESRWKYMSNLTAWNPKSAFYRTIKKQRINPSSWCCRYGDRRNPSKYFSPHKTAGQKAGLFQEIDTKGEQNAKDNLFFSLEFIAWFLPGPLFAKAAASVWRLAGLGATGAKAIGHPITMVLIDVAIQYYYAEQFREIISGLIDMADEISTKEELDEELKKLAENAQEIKKEFLSGLVGELNTARDRFSEILKKGLPANEDTQGLLQRLSVGNTTLEEICSDSGKKDLTSLVEILLVIGINNFKQENAMKSSVDSHKENIAVKHAGAEFFNILKNSESYRKYLIKLEDHNNQMQALAVKCGKEGSKILKAIGQKDPVLAGKLITASNLLRRQSNQMINLYYQKGQQASNVAVADWNAFLSRVHKAYPKEYLAHQALDKGNPIISQDAKMAYNFISLIAHACVENKPDTGKAIWALETSTIKKHIKKQIDQKKEKKQQWEPTIPGYSTRLNPMRDVGRPVFHGLGDKGNKGSWNPTSGMGSGHVDRMHKGRFKLSDPGAMEKDWARFMDNFYSSVGKGLPKINPELKNLPRRGYNEEGEATVLGSDTEHGASELR